jgi:hypothetical protein
VNGRAYKMDLEEILSGVRTVFSRVSMGASARLVLIQGRKLLFYERQRYLKRMGDYKLLKN